MVQQLYMHFFLSYQHMQTLCQAFEAKTHGVEVISRTQSGAQVSFVRSELPALESTFPFCSQTICTLLRSNVIPQEGHIIFQHMHLFHIKF